MILLIQSLDRAANLCKEMLELALPIDVEILQTQDLGVTIS